MGFGAVAGIQFWLVPAGGPVDCSLVRRAQLAGFKEQRVLDTASHTLQAQDEGLLAEGWRPLLASAG